MSKRVFWIVLSLVIFSLLLAACGGREQETVPEVAPTTAAVDEEAAVEEEAAPVEEGSNQLEFFSWWTAGGEADGLNAMYEVFREQYPDTGLKLREDQQFPNLDAMIDQLAVDESRARAFLETYDSSTVFLAQRTANCQAPAIG